MEGGRGMLWCVSYCICVPVRTYNHLVLVLHIYNNKPANVKVFIFWENKETTSINCRSPLPANHYRCDPQAALHSVFLIIPSELFIISGTVLCSRRPWSFRLYLPSYAWHYFHIILFPRKLYTITEKSSSLCSCSKKVITPFYNKDHRFSSNLAGYSRLSLWKTAIS